jgi:hypothetical protein
MKKLLLITAIVFSGMGLNASSGIPPYEKKAETSPYMQLLYNEIRGQILYPEFARSEGIEGFVILSFSFSDQGGVVISDINASNDRLMAYVVARLSVIELCSHAKKTGTNYNMRFDFRLL